MLTLDTTRGNFSDRAYPAIAFHMADPFVFGSIGRVYTVLDGLMELHHPATMAHGRRVAHLARSFARYLGLSTVTKDWIFYAALLHDIGNLFIPADLLDASPDRLNLADRKVFYDHPIKGAIAFRQFYPVPEVLYLISHHHCRNAGGGYPVQKEPQKQLWLPLQVLIIADIYDAIATPYGGTAEKPMDEALSAVTREGGLGHLSFALTQKFCRAAMSGLLVHPTFEEVRSLPPMRFLKNECRGSELH